MGVAEGDRVLIPQVCWHGLITTRWINTDYRSLVEVLSRLEKTNIHFIGTLSKLRACIIHARSTDIRQDPCKDQRAVIYHDDWIIPSSEHLIVRHVHHVS